MNQHHAPYILDFPSVRVKFGTAIAGTNLYREQGRASVLDTFFDRQFECPDGYRDVSKTGQKNTCLPPGRLELTAAFSAPFRVGAN